MNDMHSKISRKNKNDSPFGGAQLRGFSKKTTINSDGTTTTEMRSFGDND